MPTKFFEALFNGTTTLDAYTPDVGTITTETIDLQDGYLTNRFSPQALSTMSVADGFLKFPAALDGKTLVLKLTSSPSADYYVEVEFDGNPMLSVINLAIALRASTMSVAPWHASAKNYQGAQFSFYDGAGTIDAYAIWASDGTYDYSYYETTGWPNATATFTIRAAVAGDTVTVYQNGAVVKQYTSADPNYNAAGSIYVLMELYAGQVESSGGFLQVPIRRITGQTIEGTASVADNSNVLAPMPFAPRAG